MIWRYILITAVFMTGMTTIIVGSLKLIGAI
mgnify:CR=1 FL=1